MGVSKEEVVGLPTGKATITVERGPVTQFAASVTDTNPIYRNREAASDAGFDDIPVPPTYFFSGATFWGAFPEEQAPRRVVRYCPGGCPTRSRNVWKK